MRIGNVDRGLASRQYETLLAVRKVVFNGHLKEMTSALVNSTALHGILASKQYGLVNTETRRVTHETAEN